MAAISSHKMSSLVRHSGYQLVLIIVAESTTKATSRRDFILVQVHHGRKQKEAVRCYNGSSLLGRVGNRNGTRSRDRLPPSGPSLVIKFYLLLTMS